MQILRAKTAFRKEIFKAVIKYILNTGLKSPFNS